MIKKFGVITVGVAAGLMAAAPFASAGEAPQHHGDNHGGHHGGHDKSSSESCDFTGGTGEGSTGGTGSGLLAGVGGAAVGGLGGNNIANIGNCSSFLNDNLNGNSVLSGNALDL